MISRHASRKSRVLLASLALSALLGFAVPGLSVAAPLRVMLDPGHGGSDTGAARGPIKESAIALKVSLLLAELLRQDPRFKVALTRTDDHKVTLSRRTLMATQAKSDIFVSIHLNSSPEARAHGAEIYFQNQLPADEEAMYLVGRESEGEEGGAAAPQPATGKGDSLSARTDLKRILEDLHRNHRIERSGDLSKTLFQSLYSQSSAERPAKTTIRQAPFHVVSLIEVPSVLVEIGFITNPQEGPRLAQADYQRELAHLLFAGLVKYKETVDNEAAETLKSQTLSTP